MSAARAARTQSWQGNCDDLPPDRHPRARYRSTCGGEDGKANLKRVQRLWRQEGLRVAAWAAEAGSQRLRAMQINEVRCFDFVFDRTEDGMRLKWSPIYDEFTRESIALEVVRRMEASDVVRV